MKEEQMLNAACFMQKCTDSKQQKQKYNN